MRDYLNATEKNQFMVLQSIVQLVDGLRNSGVDGPKLGSMLEQWTNSNNMSKEEHKNLKTAETYLRKYLASVYERLSQKEQEVIKKKIMKFDFKLVDDYTLKQINRNIADRFVNAAVPREQFNDWCCEIMQVKCKGCTKNCNCKYAYHLGN